VIFVGCVEEEPPTKVPETTTRPTEILTPAPEVPTGVSLNIGETAKTEQNPFGEIQSALARTQVVPIVQFSTKIPLF
jgi:hypothetical protein